MPQQTAFEGLDESPIPPAVPCILARVAEGHTAEDSLILERAIANPAIPNTLLSTRLRERGVDVSEASIRKHRSATCSCYRGQQ